MEDVTESEGGSLFVDALLVRIFQSWTWLLWRRVSRICQVWQTLRNQGWGDRRGHPRSGSFSIFQRRMMSGSMWTLTAEPSPQKPVRFLASVFLIGWWLLDNTSTIRYKVSCFCFLDWPVNHYCYSIKVIYPFKEISFFIMHVAYMSLGFKVPSPPLSNLITI